MNQESSHVALLDGVSHRYGETVALDDVSLRIPACQLVGLIGPDGVGKSTLQGIIAGVRKIQQGRVEVLGETLSRPRPRREFFKRIAYVTQGLGHNTYPSLSVQENIDFFGRLFGLEAGVRQERIGRLLGATGLEPFAGRPAAKLSGGMKQKLALCCALVHEPEFLILDEPTTGVDPRSRRQFWELIDAIRARNKQMSFLVATGYLEEAEAFDHLIAMNDGRVLAEGSPDDIRERTERDSLNEAFIELLPKEQSVGQQAPRAKRGQNGTDETAIKAENLTKRFGDFVAVDGVSVDIKRGEIFGFLGSNGCGKTTAMKMLTGLLPPTEGQALLFDQPVSAEDIETRKRVGYMSQSFSLYRELTVRQNLEMHARLFDLDAEKIGSRVEEVINTYELGRIADVHPDALALGQRQRLQLAVAVIHEPEVLILDEPTSGIDPLARDRFWDLLIQLSRDEGVTVFLSTHFVSEAERCDRISLMHAGKLLAVGTPAELQEQRESETLEDAFVSYLDEAAAGEDDIAEQPDGGLQNECEDRGEPNEKNGSLMRVWAFARRDTLEILRDPIRVAFALIGPLVLMIAMGYGISFDIDELSFSVLDRDQTRESRNYIEHFSGSKYFVQSASSQSRQELAKKLDAGEIQIGILMPPGFGQQLVSGQKPEVAVWVDAADSFRGETARNYVEGVHRRFVLELASGENELQGARGQFEVVTRFRYNESFESGPAVTPGVMMMVLMLIPAMLTALAVVREKEYGSINNFYAAPVRTIEFLLGKQLPYIVIAMISFVSLLILMFFLFGVAPKGSLLLLVFAALLFVTAATGLGLVVSCFVKTQIAAIIGTAIIIIIPTINFSGMLFPFTTLEGTPRLVGQAFPMFYFQKISAGVFNKGLGFDTLYPYCIGLAVFCLSYWSAASLLLSKQEE